MSKSVNYVNEKYFKMVNQGVVGSPVDWYCRCDICGDSATNRNKKRLHLYTKNSFSGDIVHCWNCGYSSSAYNYFKNIHPEIFSSYKAEIASDLISSLKKKESSLSDIEEWDIDKEDQKEGCISLKDFKDNTDSVSKEIRDYLARRCLDKDIEKLGIRAGKEYTNLFGKQIKTRNCFLIPLFYDKDNIFGFQARSIKEKRFLTILSPKFTGEKVWNLNFIDKSKPVYVFESIFDAVSSGLDNVVALLGISKNSSLDGLDLVYCLDNQKVDKTSFETSRNLAKENQKVMVWDDDHFKDFNEILVYFNGDKTIIQNMILKNVYKGLEAYVRL